MRPPNFGLILLWAKQFFWVETLNFIELASRFYTTSPEGMHAHCGPGSVLFASVFDIIK